LAGDRGAVERTIRRRHCAVPRCPALRRHLTVGGTGKTPVAAWCVEQLRARGARPAIVMRGVGDDEWRVHGLLNPGTPVIVSADRSDGVFTARARGADCVVLDDAFQHRQAARVADVVLVSADGFSGRAHLLPAGPYREPLTALRRAQAVIVTVKAADASQVRDVVAAVHAAAPDVPVAVARLAPKSLRMAVSLRTGTPDRSAPPPPRGLLSHGAEWVAGREFSRPARLAIRTRLSVSWSRWALRYDVPIDSRITTPIRRRRPKRSPRARPGAPVSSVP
jgi:predicted GTPase